MNTNRKTIYAVISLLTLATVGGAAMAKDSKAEDARDMAAVSAMKVTLPQAIATAEQHGGGRAVGADVVSQKGASHIAVEIAAAGGNKTLMIDGQTGQVTSTLAAGQDEEDD